MTQKTTGVLFICMGNICRSPTAEGVFRKLVLDAGLEEFIKVDSAGTHAYHEGSRPDRRALEAAARRGFKLDDIRSRPLKAEDFERHDHILAMDQDNLDILFQHASAEQQSKISLFLDFSPKYVGQEVPDPYYGGALGFEKVLDLVEEASRGLLEMLQAKTRS